MGVFLYNQRKDSERIHMQPIIRACEPIYLIGMSFYGDPFELHSGWDEENQIGVLWQRFMGYLAAHPEIVRAPRPSAAMYEVHIYTKETRQKGLFEVFVGTACNLEALQDVPVELCAKVLPAARYAVFTFHGTEITSDWESMIQNWLASSGYRSALAFNFQYYDERFKGLDRLEESILDVYIPITEAA